MDNIDSSYYYTLSTIAQVLAGFLALSGVFVIRKIDLLSTSQDRAIDAFQNIWFRLLGSYKLEEEAKENIVEVEKYSATSTDYIKCLANILLMLTRGKNAFTSDMERSDWQSAKDKILEFYNQILILQIYKHVLTFLTKSSLIIGVLSIVLSITFLSLIPVLFNLKFGYIVLILAILGCTTSLLLMVMVILFSINENPEENIFYKKIKNYVSNRHPQYLKFHS